LHVGIHGHETADLLAKKGTTLLSKRTEPNFKTIKILIKQKTQDKFLQEAITLSRKTQWQNIKSTWENKNKPRKQAVALFRINTGHDCLAAHLYRIKVLSYKPLLNMQTKKYNNGQSPSPPVPKTGSNI
jgi:hypothetical protein